jgi:hypothetical protein
MSVNGSYTFPLEVVTSTLVGAEGYSVKGNGAGKVEKSAASTLAIGVVRVGAAVGSKAEIAMPGDIAPVKIAGTVYPGDMLAIDSSSTFAASTPTDGDIIGAIALEYGVTGDMPDALIVKAHRYEAG